MMLILLHANGLDLANSFRKEITEKIKLSFARVDQKINKVDVFLADQNGPKKGIDKSIRLVIDVANIPIIVIEQKGEDWSTMIECVADRASHTLIKKIKRSRSQRNRATMNADRGLTNTEDSTPEEEAWIRYRNPLDLGA